MRNKGELGRFEVLVIIILMASLFIFLSCYIFNNSDKSKMLIMKRSSESLGAIASTNRNFFNNRSVVYLNEIIDEGYTNIVKSPFSNEECSRSESKIVFNNTKNNNDYAITLKCNNYLIDGYNPVSSKDTYKIYKVSKWKNNEIKGNNVEKKTLYNCIDGSKEKYPEYYEELYLVSRINAEYGKNYTEKREIAECHVIEKTFYRTKKLIK